MLFYARTTRSTRFVSSCKGIFFPAHTLICQWEVDEFQGHSDRSPALKEGVSEIFSIVKGQIGNFVHSSYGLAKALEEVGKWHPFIMSMWSNQLPQQPLTRDFSLSFF